MRILVVEDDLEAQRYLVQGLKERFGSVKPWNVELFGGSPDDTNAFYYSVC